MWLETAAYFMQVKDGVKMAGRVQATDRLVASRIPELSHTAMIYADSLKSASSKENRD
jgi:hypothetical protein